MSEPSQARTLPELRAQVALWRRQGLTVGFVPTMGALHAGHLDLVAHALERCDRAVVSIFVNPTQFAPTEDLDRYPRDEGGDLAKLAKVGAHLVWLPAVATMYPEGEQTRVTVGGVSQGLESVTRPHFFQGVATVVAKLLNQVQADIAVFGEKDYQQLLVIKRLARDLAMPTEIIGGATVREADGLAMSSRNLLLKPEHRLAAPTLYLALNEAAAALASGAPAGPILEAAVARLEGAGFQDIDYVELRDAETLRTLPRLGNRPARLLAAAFLGPVRLIDNIPVPPRAAG